MLESKQHSMTKSKTRIKGGRSSSPRRMRDPIAQAKGMLKGGPSALKILMNERKREAQEAERGGYRFR